MAFARTVTTVHTKTLISPDTGSADLVYGQDYVSATSHTSTPAVSGATVGGIPYCPTATTEAMSGMTWNAGGAAGEGLVITAGTAASAVKALSLTQNRNFSGSATDYVNWTFPSTSTNAGDYYFRIFGGASGTTEIFSISVSNGNVSSGAGLNAGTTVVAGTYLQSVAGTAYLNNNTGLGLLLGASNATNLSWISNGVVGVGTGTQGSFSGRMKLTSVIAAGVAIASLNASPTTGEIQSVTDALVPVVGNAVASGGAAKALVWWNGAQWTVVAV